MGFRNLFLKEAKSLMPLYAVLLAAVVLLQFFVLYKRNVLENEAIFILAFLMPCIFAALVTVGAGYYQLQSEWKANTIYLLLSLPVRGWRVMSAKLAANISLLLLATAGIMASFALILVRVKWLEWRATEELPPFVPTLLNVIFHAFWMFALIVLFVLALVQFAFLCGQLVARLKWVVVLIAFIGVLWLALRVSPVLAGLLTWMPDIYFGGQDTDVIYLHAGPFLALLLMSVGLVWLNGFIYEKAVEV